MFLSKCISLSFYFAIWIFHFYNFTKNFHAFNFTENSAYCLFGIQWWFMAMPRPTSHRYFIFNNSRMQFHEFSSMIRFWNYPSKHSLICTYVHIGLDGIFDLSMMSMCHGHRNIVIAISVCIYMSIYVSTYNEYFLIFLSTENPKNSCTHHLRPAFLKVPFDKSSFFKDPWQYVKFLS